MTSYAETDNADVFDTSIPNYASYDAIYGRDGNDSITGYFNGRMTIDGGAGDDRLNFSSAVTGGEIYGGAGADYIDASAVGGSVTLYGGDTGHDTLVGGGDYSILVGGRYGSDLLIGSADNTSFYDMGGDHTTIQGSGSDSAYFINGYADFVTGQSGNYYLGGNFGTDTVSSYGGPGNFFVSSRNNVVNGSFAPDFFIVTGRSNTIVTGDGNNLVYAGYADNVTVNGGANNDVIFVGGTYTGGYVTGSTVSNGNQYNNIEVSAGGGSNIVDGRGGLGVLFINPGVGLGTNVVTGDDVSNHIYGQLCTGQLFMRGGRGGDEMVGGEGGNTFIGTGGSDFVRANGIANVFCFNAIGEGGLHIANFNANTDRIAVYAGGFGSQLYGNETLTAGYNLINGSTSTQQTGTFLYHDAILFFDPDGTGNIAPTALAGFTAGSNAVPTALSSNNFSISGTML